MITLFIADDSKMLRDRLISMINDFEQIKIVGEARDGLTAIEKIKQLKPNIVILDIRMPGANGIIVLETIKNLKPAPIVIIFTNYPYPQYRKKCMALGADYFFDKSNEFDKILRLFENFNARNSLKEPFPKESGE